MRRAMMGGSALWTPERVNTALWLDAADDSTFTLSSDKVTHWRDKSGKANNASQGNSTYQPSKLTGVVEFSAHYLIIPDHSSLQFGTDAFAVYSAMLLYVAELGSWEARTFISKGYPGFETYNTAGLLGIYIGGDVIKANLTGAVAYKPEIHTGYRSAGVMTSRKTNNSAVSTGNTLSASKIGTPVFIGCRSPLNNNLYHKGLIYEIIITPYFDQNIDNKITGYLAHKLGIAHELHDLHPYKSSPPRV